MSDIPHADDVRIHTQADLERTWRRLMEPLGFGDTSIWIMPISPDGRVGHLIEIAECPTVLEVGMAAGFAELLAHLREQLYPDVRWALLRTRPGHDGPGANDRAWAVGLVGACRDAGLATEVVHLATDAVLTPLPLDDLPQAG